MLIRICLIYRHFLIVLTYIFKTMTIQQIFNTVLKRKWLLFWLMLFGAVLAFDLSLLQEPQYKASSKVLIVQKQTQGQDIYTISKSAQYLTKILKQGVYSDIFFNQVLTSSDKITSEDFASTPKQRRQDWKKDVQIRILQDLGVMEINVFNANPEKITDINEIITNNLVANHQFYHGAGENVEVKILDSPLVSQKPVKPILWLNTIIGAIIGFLFGLALALRKKKPKEASSLHRSGFSVPRGGF